MKKLKSIIAVVLAILMLCVPTVSYAAEETTTNKAEATFDSIQAFFNYLKQLIDEFVAMIEKIFRIAHKEPVPVEAVSADKAELELIVGDTDKITAAVTPENADNTKVTFASSDEAVVTVDAEGNVTAINRGKATITITAVADASKTCAVAVKVDVPNPDGYYAVETAEELKAALEAGEKFIVLTDDLAITEAIVIPADKEVTINAKGYTIKRAEGADVVIFALEANSILTLEDVVADGGAVWSGDIDPVLGRGTVNTGATTAASIVTTAANASIVLGEGAVLQNNDGANAVNLGTRIGATLILDGGEIINNNSGAGAVWGGGNITIIDGKINNNSSTGPAGAIRMVSNCNLTMLGGEINNNKAATSGGAIYGYGASTYTLSGGEIAYNNAALGGAIYTGDSSKFYVSGEFELHDNTAADAGAIRFTNYTSLYMTGGKIYNNKSLNTPNWDFAYGWNLYPEITGGEIADQFIVQAGYIPLIGAADITGVVHFALATTHNTVKLSADFKGFSFTVAEGNNFAEFNFQPAADYEYAEGDEAKLICMNEGYETYWTGTVFKIKAVD